MYFIVNKNYFFPDLLHIACRDGPVEDRCLAWTLTHINKVMNQQPIMLAQAANITDCAKVK